MAISHIDREILTRLLADGRRSFRDLAEEVHLGATATADRVRRLVAAGVIASFTTVVPPEALGRPLHAAIDVQLRPDIDAPAFEHGLTAIAEVIDAVHLTGRSDYLLRVVCRSPADLDRIISAIKAAGAAATETRLVLRSVEGLGMTRLVASG